MTALTHKRLLELLHYDPETGVFTWKQDRDGPARAGDRAGCKQKPWVKGRTTPWRMIKIDGKSYQESRLAWFYMTGEWPIAEIDHRDQDRLNNAWDNLRSATKAQNCANRGKRRDNTSGFKGVARRGSRFRAYARLGGVYRYLGTFATAEEAHAVYCAAVDAAYGEYARHG